MHHGGTSPVRSLAASSVQNPRLVSFSPGGSAEEMADLSVSAHRSVVGGREWIFLLSHPHSLMLQRGKGQTSSVRGRFYSHRLFPDLSSVIRCEFAVAVSYWPECRHDPTGLLDTNATNERPASEKSGMYTVMSCFCVRYPVCSKTQRPLLLLT